MLAKFKFFPVFFIILGIFWTNSYAASQNNPQIATGYFFPSANPLAKDYLQAIYAGKKDLLKAGYSKKDIKQIFLAIDQRDKVWDQADFILKGIQSGAINEINIQPYFSNEIKIGALNFIVLTKLIHHLHSLGDKTILSTKYYKDKPVDLMMIRKKIGNDEVYIQVVKKIPSENEIIFLTFSAHDPYDKWLLVGLHTTFIYHHPFSKE